MTHFIEIFGWVASLIILIAYLLVSNGKLLGTSLTYQLLNIIGALGLLINSFYHKAFPSVALNAIWIVVAILAVRRIKKLQDKNTSKS